MQFRLMAAFVALLACVAPGFAQTTGAQPTAPPTLGQAYNTGTAAFGGQNTGATTTMLSPGNVVDTTSFSVDFGQITNTMQARFNPALAAVALGGAAVAATVGAVFFVIGRMRAMFH